jgi:hypothetical protein
MDDLSILLQQWGPCSMASLRVPMIRSVTTRQ